MAAQFTPYRKQIHLVQSLGVGFGTASLGCGLSLGGILPESFEAEGYWQLFALFLLGFGMAWVGLHVESLLWRVLIPSLAAGELFLAARLADAYGSNLHPGPALLVILLCWGVCEWIGRETHLQAAVLEPAGPATPAKEALTPRRIGCTVLHCELVNHSQLAEQLPPEEFAALVNRLLTACHQTASARFGESDRADSEAFRAVFTPQTDGESHSEAAMQTALALRARIAALSEENEARFGLELDARLGINQGEMLLAPFGAPENTRTGVAGEPAEWARRLAGANLLYGTRILMGARAMEQAGDSVETRPIDRLQRRLPPHPPEEVFELVALQGTLDAESLTRLTHYRRGVAHLRNRNWKAARAALRAARPIGRSDDAIDLLLHRIDEQETLASFAQHIE